MEYFFSNEYYLLSLFVCIFLFVFNIIVVVSDLKTNEKTVKRNYIVIDWAFVIFATAFVIVSRLYTIDCQITNLDEAFDLSLTLDLAKGYHFWIDFNPTSVGPINTWIFYLVSLCIGEVSFLTAKIAALGVIIISLYFIYFAICKLSSRSIAVALSSCFAFYMTIPWSAPIVSYNTEYSLILTLSIYFCCFVRFDTSKFAQIVSFGILALMPFCKLQGAPLALFLYICGLIRLCKSLGMTTQLFKRLLLVAIISSIPVVILLIDCTLHDSFIWFYRYYIQSMISYVDVQTSLYSYCNNFLDLVSDNIYVILFFIIAMILELVLFLNKSWKVSIFSLLILTISVYEMLKPNFAFLHYTNLLIIPLIFVVALQINYIKTKMVSILVLLISLVYQFYQLSLFDEYFDLKQSVLVNSNSHTFWKSIGLDIKSLSNSSDKLMIWGWLDEVQVFAQLATGSSELGIGAFIHQNFVNRNYPSYTKEKFKADLLKNKPRFFLDSPSPITQIYNDYKYSVLNFPEFADIINNNYHVLKQYLYPITGIKDCNYKVVTTDGEQEGCIITLYEVND